MQIGSGPSSLSLAMLKSLGIEAPAGGAAGGLPAKAAAADPKPATPQKAAVEPAVAAGEGSTELGVARDIPRGSFVDLKV